MKNKTERDAWRNMIHSCLNPKHPGYKYAGAIGAKVDERWLGKVTGFKNFLADVGEKPDKKLVLSRRDPAIDFQPGNVAWLVHNSTRRAKPRHHRGKTIRYTWEGQDLKLGEWAKLKGIKNNTIYTRWGRGLRGEELLSPDHGRLGQKGGFNPANSLLN